MSIDYSDMAFPKPRKKKKRKIHKKSILTLHDEFGFGTQRCDRFIKRFNKKAECIMDDMASWNDYIKTIKEELGIELGIRENK